VAIHARLYYLHVVIPKLKVWTKGGFKDQFGDELKDGNIFQAFSKASNGMHIKWVKIHKNYSCLILLS
jgi:hypothetical protein